MSEIGQQARNHMHRRRPKVAGGWWAEAGFGRGTGSLSGAIALLGRIRPATIRLPRPARPSRPRSGEGPCPEPRVSVAVRSGTERFRDATEVNAGPHLPLMGGNNAQCGFVAARSLSVTSKLIHSCKGV